MNKKLEKALKLSAVKKPYQKETTVGRRAVGRLSQRDR
jgi:hypothetical protein